jgi:hypothetical protein
MRSARRTAAVVALLAAALALGWTTSRVWGPAVSGSERPSVTADQGSSTSDSAVIQRSPSLVRALAGDRPSGSWELATAAGLACLAAAAFWTRRRADDERTRPQLHPLRGTVALRAPPLTELV